MTKRVAVVLLVATAVVASLSGCGSGGNDKAVSDSRAPDSRASQSGAAEGAGGDASRAGDANAVGFDLDAVVPVDAGRQIVSTAELTVQTRDVEGAGQRAAAAVESVGGVLYAESSSFQDDVTSTLTFKVPPSEFRRMLTRLADLGTPVSQSVTTDDVTKRVVDLQSRITTSEASVRRLRGFLDEVTDVNQIAGLENELLTRETDLETLRGELRTLKGQVDAATIVLTLVADQDLVPDADQATALPGFLDGLRGGWNAFLAVGTVVLAALGALLPWLPVLLGAWGVVWLVRRNRKRPGPDERLAAG